jgi:hypothetical protein
MDILTKRGRETLDQVTDAINIWRRNLPTIQYIHTPADRPADFDGILVHNGRAAGIAEIKCRVSMSFDQFMGRYNAEWLVTFDKITRCMRAADAMQVPFLGMLYFPGQRILLYQSIYDPVDGLRTSMRVERSRTQATVNGGKIDRDNAYIDMSNAKRMQ